MPNYNIYLIKRGPKPAHHAAPYSPIILCTLKRVADWEAGWSGDGAWMWEFSRGFGYGGGWLLVRWNGFPIDYGYIVRGLTLPDGTQGAFWRSYKSDDGNYIGGLFPGATWWSTKEMPEWFKERGVVYPADDYSQQCILDITADDGCMGCVRDVPAFWPKAIMVKYGRNE